MPTPAKKTEPAFARKADTYDVHAHVQSDAARWLAEWLPEAAKDSHCLEMGAGTGLLTQHLINRFTHVESSDLSADMLRICQERVPKATCRVRDAWAFSKSQENWDFLVSSSLLQWAPCPDGALRHWSSLVKRSGHLILGFFVKPSLPEMMKVIGGKGPVTWRSPQEWGEIFANNDFHLVRMESETRSYHYESALHLWKSLHGTGATVSRSMSPSAMLRFFRDYESFFRQRDGVYASWTFCRVELQT